MKTRLLALIAAVALANGAAAQSIGSNGPILAYNPPPSILLSQANIWTNNQTISGAASASVSPLLISSTLYTGGTSTTNYPYLYIRDPAASAPTISTAGNGIVINMPSGFGGRFLTLHTNGGTAVATISNSGSYSAPNGNFVGNQGSFSATTALNFTTANARMTWTDLSIGSNSGILSVRNAGNSADAGITAGAAAFSGATSITGTSAPTLANGTAGIYASATGGAIFTGQGSTSDLTLANKSGSAILTVATGTTTAAFQGSLSVANGFSVGGGGGNFAINGSGADFSVNTSSTKSSTSQPSFRFVIGGSGLTASSGTQIFGQISPNINQSGTAGFDMLQIVANEVATGSGTKNLLHGLAGSSGATEVFSITTAGAFTTTGKVRSNTGFNFNGTDGITASGASCTITAISGGIITAGSCV